MATLNKVSLAIVGAAFLALGTGTAAGAVTIDFGPTTIDTSTNALITQGTPINGKTVTQLGAQANQGVTFAVTNNGPGFDPTNFTVSNQLGSTKIIPPSLVGTTQDALQFNFQTPTQASSLLSFALGLNNANPVPNGFTVDLYNSSSSNPIYTQQVSTTPDGALSDAVFTYNGASVNKVVVTPSKTAAFTYAFDTLTYTPIIQDTTPVGTPEPATGNGLLILGAFGTGVWLLGKKFGSVKALWF